MLLALRERNHRALARAGDEFTRSGPLEKHLGRRDRCGLIALRLQASNLTQSDRPVSPGRPRQT